MLSVICLTGEGVRVRFNTGCQRSAKCQVPAFLVAAAAAALGEQRVNKTKGG